MRRFAIVLLAALSVGAALAQEDGEPASRVALSGPFELHSAFWLNLHDHLYGLAQGEDEDEDMPFCLIDLDDDLRVAWADAVEHYEADLGQRHHRRDPLMVAIRTRFAGLGDTRGGYDEAELDTALDILDAAAPVYRQCEWDDQDRANRRWIAALGEEMSAYGAEIEARLTELYRERLPETIRADVVGYASWGGANTLGRQEHIMISSDNEGYQGLAALEMIFHEASHLLIGPGHGAVSDALDRAARRRQVEVPRDLWHAVLFYTTGKTVQALLAEAGHEYEPYVYARGLFERSWSEFREPLETHWQPYLDGAADLAAAAVALIAATTEAPEKAGDGPAA